MLYALKEPVAKRTPDGEEDDMPGGSADGDRLEERWDRALDTARGAVTAGDRAHTLTSKEIAAANAHLREEREWLGRFRPTLRRLLRHRKRSEKQPAH